ncbi:MAG: PAS domain-containing protein [Nitrospirae bacterium]|nr:PAS domain-containing protein [Nitrospirota bacterium]
MASGGADCGNSPSLEREIIPVVAIGASAGGLEALEGFFSNLTDNHNISFIIIQHLSPVHKSIMSSILEKYTPMNIQEIEDGMEIRAGAVYINPPDKYVAIAKGVLHLMPTVKSHGINLPIDYFFSSLAQEVGEKAVCIILSGTGTDGTLGLKAVKGAGGLTIVQERLQAKYDGMPGSAIETNMVDYVLGVEDMPKVLYNYLSQPYIKGSTDSMSNSTLAEKKLQKIFILIRNATGHDFSGYKYSTIGRRVERRMAVHQFGDLDAYIGYLSRTPKEVDNLFRDLLIGVTSFFRDKEAFEVLRDNAIYDTLDGRDTGAPVRVWVAGCSTGEEAYSIAIILEEAMERLKKRFIVQIYASDIDCGAIDFARAAVYPENIAAHVTKERLGRYFTKNGNVFKVNKQIREMVVFAVQDVIKDPPFSQIDLVSCRNLLIYMNPDLQRRVLPVFHYSLNSGGFLFLGSSESIGEYGDYFSTIDSKWKLFKRKNVFKNNEYLSYLPPVFQRGPTSQKPVESPAFHKDDIYKSIDKFILENLCPPAVLVNEKFDILYLSGKTEKYLKPLSGKPDVNLLGMAREELRYRLGTLVHRAVKENVPVLYDAASVIGDGGIGNVGIEIIALKEPFPKGAMLVVFKEENLQNADNPAGVDNPDNRRSVPDGRQGEEFSVVSHLRDELKSAKLYLQHTIEELETSNEDLKSANEELQSVNEELQSTNEELQTSKEELQSTNEELSTVNLEMGNKVNELSKSNDDMNNLLACTEIGTIFLDDDFRIKRYTPSVTGIFNIISTDVGRPLTDITSTLLYENTFEDAMQVLNTLVPRGVEVQTRDNKWYCMRIIPYHTVDNVINGVVITFADVTALKATEASLKQSGERYQSLFHEARAGIILTDASTGSIVECNGEFLRLAGKTLDELQGMKLWDVNVFEDAQSVRDDYFGISKTAGAQPMSLRLGSKDAPSAAAELLNVTVEIKGRKYIQSIMYDISMRDRVF